LKKIGKRKKFKKQDHQKLLGYFDSLYQLHLTGFDEYPQCYYDSEYAKIRTVILSTLENRYIKEGTEKYQALMFFRAWLQDLYLNHGIATIIEDSSPNDYLKIDTDYLDKTGEYKTPMPEEIDVVSCYVDPRIRLKELAEKGKIQGSDPVEIYSFQNIQNRFYDWV